jgi:hypothetical protein
MRQCYLLPNELAVLELYCLVSALLKFRYIPHAIFCLPHYYFEMFESDYMADLKFNVTMLIYGRHTCEL